MTPSSMSDHLKWSASEKKIARKAFDAALDAALAEVMAEFKQRAAAATTPEEMWQVEDYLQKQRRMIAETFDYRYSQLPLVFAGLIRKGLLDERLIAGLSEDKHEVIRRYLALGANGNGTLLHRDRAPASLQDA